jgi:hypothetical protein
VNKSAFDVEKNRIQDEITEYTEAKLDDFNKSKLFIFLNFRTA